MSVISLSFVCFLMADNMHLVYSQCVALNFILGFFCAQTEWQNKKKKKSQEAFNYVNLGLQRKKMLGGHVEKRNPQTDTVKTEIPFQQLANR